MVKVTPHSPSPLPPRTRTRTTGALRRLVFAATAGASLAAASFSAAPTAAYADGAPETRPLTPLAPFAPLLAPLGRASDHLTVTVHGTGGRADGRFELVCHPGAGVIPTSTGPAGRSTGGLDGGRIRSPP